MFVIRRHLASELYIVVNVTTGYTVFGPSSYNECATVVEYLRVRSY